eukprot:6485937-Amphidinium_carterae.1
MVHALENYPLIPVDTDYACGLMPFMLPRQTSRHRLNYGAPTILTNVYESWKMQLATNMHMT